MADIVPLQAIQLDQAWHATRLLAAALRLPGRNGLKNLDEKRLRIGPQTVRADNTL